MTRLAPAFYLFALILAAAPALAGPPTLGPVGPMPAMSGVPGRVAAPAGAGSFAPLGSTVSGVGMNVTNTDGVSVQTNIQAGSNVQAGSNLNVNETINGVPVGYGVGGDFLAGADALAQEQWAQKQAFYQQLQNDVSLTVQVWQAEGN